MTIEETLLATWPPAALHRRGLWTLAEGKGGGKRVSCAWAEDSAAWTGTTAADLQAEITRAETAQAELGQEALFMLRPGQEVLDEALARRGYECVDPCHLYQGEIATLAGQGPAWMTTFPHWPPLERAREIWAEGGIGPDRLKVMERVQGPRTIVLGRCRDRAAGVAFVALHGDQAMLHALEVSPAFRRQGLARQLMRAAAHWAQDQGARSLALAVTRANLPANALYTTLGMQVVTMYHYRKKPA